MSPRTFCTALFAAAVLAGVSGCHLVLPETTHQPLVHNPFPQFSRVAVVPFFNQSGEPTVDGRVFAQAYFAELQAVPGFEVVPVATVEAAIVRFGITFDPPDTAGEQARYLAKKLGVDAVVVGTVTDFDPYYPPRCGMRVEWYAANAGFREIPAGYGLPWGTAQEEFIPDRLVFEAEMALARAQMATQSPEVFGEGEPAAPAPLSRPADALPIVPEALGPEAVDPNQGDLFDEVESLPVPPADRVDNASFEAEIDNGAVVSPNSPTTAPAHPGGGIGAIGPPPEGWPDARGFTPPGPVPVRPRVERHAGPVMTHTRIYHGSDAEFTAALASYVGFRDDARFGGWQSYLSRSEDFVRFCCHLHLNEMLSARGGGGETRVVRRWSANR